MKYRVICIAKKPSHDDRHHHITAIGIEKAHGTETLTAAQAISQIEHPQGDRYYVEGGDGSQAEVIVHEYHSNGNHHRILTTTPDHTKKDNLLSLPECSSGGNRGGGGVPPRPTPPGPVPPPRPSGPRPVGRS
jgi:hypothetical protein